MNIECMTRNKVPEWETPSDLYAKLDNEFHFTLDVAANESNNKCDKFFTKNDDGLSKNWGGETVWCNPPYGREIEKWVRKAFFENVEWNVTVVLLLPARTDTRWFHNYVYNKAEVRFIRKRLRFNNKDNAPFPSMIVIYRKRE